MTKLKPTSLLTSLNEVRPQSRRLSVNMDKYSHSLPGKYTSSQAVQGRETATELDKQLEGYSKG